MINSHWEPHVFYLPIVAAGFEWHFRMDAQSSLIGDPNSEEKVIRIKNG